MNRAIILTFFLFSSCIAVISQNVTPPAFVMLEEVVVTADDPRFAPLFYSTSETGEGSLAYAIFSAVDSGKLKLWTDPVKMNETINWDTLKNNCGYTMKSMLDKNKTSTLYPNGNIPVYLPFDINNIRRFTIKFLACYSRDNILISRKVVSIIPYVDNILYMDCYNTSTHGYIYTFSINDSRLSDILVGKMEAPDFQDKSYFEFISSISIDSTKYESHMVSFNYAHSQFPWFNYITAEDSLFEFPETIQKDARIVVFKSSNSENELNNAQLNTFGNGVNLFTLSELLETKKERFSNFPLFCPPIYNGFGYVAIYDIIWYIVTHESKNIFPYNSEIYFSVNMKREDVNNTFYYKRKLGKNVFDPFTGEELSGKTVEQEVSLNGFLILYLKDGSKMFPLALCPCGHFYKKTEKIDKGPLAWFPINSELRKKLVEGQAYLPGFGIQMNLLNYLSSEIISGTIISERPIDNEEWQKLLEILK